MLIRSNGKLYLCDEKLSQLLSASCELAFNDSYNQAMSLEEAIHSLDCSYKRKYVLKWDPIKKEVRMPKASRDSIDELGKALRSLAENTDIAELLTSENELVRDMGKDYQKEIDCIGKTYPELIEGVRTRGELLKRMHAKFGKTLPIFEERGVSIGNPNAVAKAVLKR